MNSKIWIIIILTAAVYFLVAPYQQPVSTTNALTISNSYSSVEPASHEQEQIQLIAQIAQQYSETHTYIPGDVFDCDNMAQEMWNMLKTRGIISRIMVGNVENSSATTLQDSNHAWVMVELDSGDIAIETTGGYLVYRADNENYYRGFSFKDPKIFRDFLKLYSDYKRQTTEYNIQIDYYNRLVAIYNKSNGIERMKMESGLQVVRLNIEELGRNMEYTWAEISNILNSK